jgi:hypothetical protein
LLDRAVVKARQHIQIVAQESDADLFLRETFPIGNRLRDKLRRGLALQAGCRQAVLRARTRGVARGLSQD